MNHRPRILEQVIKPQEGNLSAEHARYILALRIPHFLQQRYVGLAEKAQSGTLSAREQHELDEFLDADAFLSVLKSKARVSLKKHGKAA